MSRVSGEDGTGSSGTRGRCIYYSVSGTRSLLNRKSEPLSVTLCRYASTSITDIFVWVVNLVNNGRKLAALYRTIGLKLGIDGNFIYVKRARMWAERTSSDGRHFQTSTTGNLTGASGPSSPPAFAIASFHARAILWRRGSSGESRNSSRNRGSIWPSFSEPCKGHRVKWLVTLPLLGSFRSGVSMVAR